MFPRHNDSEELGMKVQRAQHALEQTRGIGTVRGIRVTVDADNRLLSVTVDEEGTILEAYQAALADKQPKVDDALRELRADPRFEAVSTFAEANSAREEAERVERQRDFEEEDDEYYAERNRRGWLEG